MKEGQIVLVGRISYPKIFRAAGIKNDASSKPRYGCNILVPKSDTKAKAAIDQEIERLAKLRFKGVVPKSKDLFIRDGDIDGDEYSEGHWVVSANRSEAQGRPRIVDIRKNPITEEDNLIFAGCDCRFVIGVYAPKDWKKICASLEVVQFIRPNTPFGSTGVDLDEILPDFDGVEDEDGL